MYTYAKYGGAKPVFTREQLKDLKFLCEAGVQLLGFRPRSSMQPYHNVKHANFLVPADDVVKGSCTLFLSLLKAMQQRDVVAIANVVARRASQPRLAVLVPSAAPAPASPGSGGGAVQEPTGLHVVWLPFVDDMRELNVVGDAAAAAAAAAADAGGGGEGEGEGPTDEGPTDEEVEVCRRMVRRLEQPGFRCEQHPNPGLQKHYQNLQMIALEQPTEDAVRQTLRQYRYCCSTRVRRAVAL